MESKILKVSPPSVEHTRAGDAMKKINPIRCPRDLTARERELLKRFSRIKSYDQNHPEEKRRYRILERVFVPADYKGDPLVIFLCLCQRSATRANGKFEYVIFTDGLYGRGHWPSDSYGFGDRAHAMASLDEHLVHALLGSWRWVVNRVLKDARLIAGRPLKRPRKRLLQPTHA